MTTDTLLRYTSTDMHGRLCRLAVQHKVWLENGNRFVLGDGGIALFRAVEATGSLRAASEEVGWSYRHALAYVDNAERALGYRLVDRVRGGNDRGGANLTSQGRHLVWEYAAFRARLDRALRRLYKASFSDPVR